MYCEKDTTLVAVGECVNFFMGIMVRARNPIARSILAFRSNVRGSNEASPVR